MMIILGSIEWLAAKPAALSAQQPAYTLRPFAMHRSSGRRSATVPRHLSAGAQPLAFLFALHYVCGSIFGAFLNSPALNCAHRLRRLAEITMLGNSVMHTAAAETEAAADTASERLVKLGEELETLRHVAVQLRGAGRIKEYRAVRKNAQDLERTLAKETAEFSTNFYGRTPGGGEPRPKS